MFELKYRLQVKKNDTACIIIIHQFDRSSKRNFVAFRLSQNFIDIKRGGKLHT